MTSTPFLKPTSCQIEEEVKTLISVISTPFMTQTSSFQIEVFKPSSRVIY